MESRRGVNIGSWDPIYQPSLNGPVQGPVREVYDYLENRIGEELTPEVAQRVGKHPRLIGLLRTDWPPVDRLLDRAESLDAIVGRRIRPTIAGWRGKEAAVATASRLLLYVDEVVIESDAISIGGDSPEDDLVRIAKMKPLVMDGSIKFAGRYRAHQRGGSIAYMAPLAALPPEAWQTGTENDFFTNRGNLGNLSAGSYLLVEEGKATPLALSHNEEVAHAALFTGHLIGGRYSQVATLGRLAVPDISGDIRRLVQLRKTEDSFANWRTHLAAALSAIERIPDGPEALLRAREIVADELSASLEGVRITAESSPAVRALREGFKRLGFSGVGAGFGFGTAEILGDPLNPVLTSVGMSVVTNSATTLYDYLRFRRERRDSAAIWDVALSFRGA